MSLAAASLPRDPVRAGAWTTTARGLLIREARLAGRTYLGDAVVHGGRMMAGVVTSAAIMVAVFHLGKSAADAVHEAGWQFPGGCGPLSTPLANAGCYPGRDVAAKERNWYSRWLAGVALTPALTICSALARAAQHFGERFLAAGRRTTGPQPLRV